MLAFVQDWARRDGKRLWSRVVGPEPRYGPVAVHLLVESVAVSAKASRLYPEAALAMI